MKKKRYIQPEIEVIATGTNTLLAGSFDGDITNPTGGNEGKVPTGGNTEDTDDVPAPVFFPDLD